jgi:hypothetical protein
MTKIPVPHGSILLAAEPTLPMIFPGIAPVAELVLEVQMDFRLFSSFACRSKDLSALLQVHKSLHERLLARAEHIHTSSPTLEEIPRIY